MDLATTPGNPFPPHVPHDRLRHRILGLLHTGQCNIHTLTEIARIGDPALTEALLAQPSRPRQVLRLLPGASARKQNATPPVYLSTPKLAAAQEVFSAEIDEVGAPETIAELAARVGWRDQNRTLAATRTDETTLIVYWQITTR